MFAEDKVKSIIRNQVCDLEEKLNEAKIKFAEACLDEDYSGKLDQQISCKNISAQIEILDKIELDILSILEPAVA